MGGVASSVWCGGRVDLGSPIPREKQQHFSLPIVQRAAKLSSAWVWYRHVCTCPGQAARGYACCVGVADLEWMATAAQRAANAREA